MTCLRKVLYTRNNICFYQVLQRTVSSLLFDKRGIHFTPRKYEQSPKPNFFPLHEDAHLTVPEIIHKYGYPIEEHEVVTRDGYILTMHRIPYGNYRGMNLVRPAVLVVHGFTSNSADSIIAGPDNALSFFLADSGYDVWIANTRGNRYSLKHVSLDINSKEYWDFSWPDIATNDLPAMVDQVLLTTNQKQIYYIGHSRGTTVSYVMCSELPEYNKKLRAIISLAPVAYMSHIPGPLFRTSAKMLTNIRKALELSNTYQISPNRKMIAKFGESFCCDGTKTQMYIEKLLFFLGGDDTQFNSTLLPIILGHVPDAFSTKEAMHFGQLINSGKFQNYDYGERRNLQVYGAVTPTEYNLGKIEAPVALFYSNNDSQSSAIDVAQLYRELRNPIGKYLVSSKPNHFSYLYGRKILKTLYQEILRIMRDY